MRSTYIYTNTGMGKTFYSALGVDTDADVETIQQRYRERVREAHPDVSDRDDAQEEFTRLTTARDVLVDDAERERYERLGHETYISTYDSAGWTPDVDDTPERRQRARGNHRPADRHDQSTSRTDGGYATADWQTAAGVYRHKSTDSAYEPGLVYRVLTNLRQLGGWVVIHSLLLFSSGSLAWFTYRASTTTDLPLLGLTIIVGVFPLVLALSVLHLLCMLSS